VSKRAPSETPKAKLSKQFTIQDVIVKTYKEQIRAHISEETDASVSNKAWLPYYPAALSNVMESLTEKEIMVEEWNNDGLPRDVQRV
jgi:hypothetical protein